MALEDKHTAAFLPVPGSAQKEQSPSTSAMSCSTASPTSSRPSSASSRSRPSSATSLSRHSSTSSVGPLPRVDDKMIRRSSSSSRLGNLDPDCLPSLLKSPQPESLRKESRKGERRSTVGSTVLRKAALSTVAGKLPLARRKTVPETSEKALSTVVGKLPLARRKTVPETSEKALATPKLNRSRSDSGFGQQYNSSCNQGPSAEAQGVAIQKLAAHFASYEKSFEAIIASLCSVVVKENGNTAFLPDDVRQAIIYVLHDRDLGSTVAEKSPHEIFAPWGEGVWATEKSKAIVGSLVLRVFNALVREGTVAAGDVQGQILWYHRKNDALQDRMMQKVAKDLSWIDLLDCGRMGARPRDLVDVVFHKYASEAGLLEERAFLKIMDRSLHEYIVKVNGVTLFTGSRASCRRTDLDQLYFGQKNRQGLHGINPQGFREALTTFAQNIQVHPRSVFMTVGQLGS